MDDNFFRPLLLTDAWTDFQEQYGRHRKLPIIVPIVFTVQGMEQTQFYVSPLSTWIKQSYPFYVVYVDL